jgi:hypothetical protein
VATNLGSRPLGAPTPVAPKPTSTSKPSTGLTSAEKKAISSELDLVNQALTDVLNSLTYAQDTGTFGGAVPGAGTTSTATSTVTPSNNKQAQITEDIRMLLGLANLDPDLKEAWNAFNQERYDDMYAAIYRSSFYKNNTSTARLRQAAKERQPGAYLSEFNDWKLNTYKRLRETGIQITPSIEAQIESAYLLGMSDTQVDDFISQKGLIGSIGGRIGGDVADLKSYASQFAVGNYYNDAYWEQAKKNIFDGTTTLQDEQQKIRDLAASMYPAFSDGIKAGRSMAADAAYITQILTNRTGRPVTIDSAEAQRFMQWQNPQTGKFEMPPGWVVDREAWKLPGADRTPDAIAKGDAISRKVLQDLGLMY